MRFYEFKPLTEDRITYVADQLNDKLISRYKQDTGDTTTDITATEIVNKLAVASKKAVQWLANRYVAGEYKLEDVPQIKQELMKFAQVLPKLPPEQKDLNSLSLRDLYKVLKPFEEKEVVSNKGADRKTKEKLLQKEAELIYKDNQVTVIVPKTEKASCYFGKGTKWCTAAKNDNLFDQYYADGPLYIIMTKEGKYQFQFGSQSYMDAEDIALDGDDLRKLVDSYPQLYKVFEKQATQHGVLVLIKNPSEAVQLKAARQDGYVIEYIKNPSEAVQLQAVKQYGIVIKYIKNPSEAVQFEAVKSIGQAIMYIKNPSEALQLLAVKDRGEFLGLIKNPTEEMKLIAVKENGFSIEHIKNPSEALQLLAVKEAGEALKHIKNPSKAVQLQAVKNTGWAIRSIANPSEALQLLAVKGNGLDALQFIENPSEAVKRAAELAELSK